MSPVIDVIGQLNCHVIGCKTSLTVMLLAVRLVNCHVIGCKTRNS